jgi:hypothetical protein
MVYFRIKSNDLVNSQLNFKAQDRTLDIIDAGTLAHAQDMWYDLPGVSAGLGAAELANIMNFFTA